MGCPEPRTFNGGRRRHTLCPQLLLVCAAVTISQAGGDADENGVPAVSPRVVLLWPEEARTFRNGKGVIAALVTTNFDTPREGSIELLLNGNNAANFTPEAMDSEGNRRLHVVLPDLSDGQFSVEIRCIGVDGSLLARAGATFSVDSTAPTKQSSVSSLEQAKLCHPIGFCDSDAECNGHGSCSQGACLCRGDWVGENCEHDIYHAPSFLPDSNPGRSPSLCHRSPVWEEAAKKMHEDLLELHALQHCVEEDNILWLEAPHHGLGGNMHILSVALTHAYTHRKALGIVGEWTYGAHQGCTSGWGLSCYFESHAPQCPHLVARERPDDLGSTAVVREEDPAWMWEQVAQ
jgi:hypothetical protein